MLVPVTLIPVRLVGIPAQEGRRDIVIADTDIKIAVRFSVDVVDALGDNIRSAGTVHPDQEAWKFSAVTARTLPIILILNPRSERTLILPSEIMVALNSNNSIINERKDKNYQISRSLPSPTKK
ncbi:hypothetical protein DBV15_10904 [Temnothorax longispinosus]|uniref:Uncharacterized protein n=1 Tax=Temnothorax longispinosus TaxID=300112 RepID=A0A4S2JPU2_9HYME|nr:hypothetical protein DBV15_10904 [Temnothorax longispinosus]